MSLLFQSFGSSEHLDAFIMPKSCTCCENFAFSFSPQTRFFVLRVEDTSSKHERHAFLGIGFRERTEAYDFQAALHDHVKYPDQRCSS